MSAVGFRLFLTVVLVLDLLPVSITEPRKGKMETIRFIGFCNNNLESSLVIFFSAAYIAGTRLMAKTRQARMAMVLVKDLRMVKPP
jgi:hypothetical protein